MGDASFLWAAGVAILAAFAAAALTARLLLRLGLAPAPRDLGRNPALDGLRGGLALAVVAHHFLVWLNIAHGGANHGLSWAAPAFAPFNHLGLGAVCLFFMITGYVFAPFMTRGDLGAFGPLVLRRLFRLQPMVVASIAMVGAVCLILRGGQAAPRDIPALLIWLSCWREPDIFGVRDAGWINAHVLWSLKFEWLFTLALLPLTSFCARAFGGGKRGWAGPGALLPLLLIAGWLTTPGGALAALLMLAPPFLIGALAHEFLARAKLRAWVSRRWLLPAATLGLALATISAPTPFAPLQLALYALFFLSVAARQNMAMMTCAVAQALGTWSYAVYLLHGIALSLLFTEGAALVAFLPGAKALALLPPMAALVVILAAAAHAAIERPFAAFGRRLWSGSREAAATAAAAT